LQASWPRPWVDNDTGEAWLAYDAAVREVSPAAILAGAKAWVEDAERPRFLPSLAKWLITRSWEKPPPWGRVKARQDKAAHDAPRYRGKPDLAQIALAQGRRIQAERAGL
jgi:hypothetical protein